MRCAISQGIASLFGIGIRSGEPMTVKEMGPLGANWAAFPVCRFLENR
jgi:hypothetical protein